MMFQLFLTSLNLWSTYRRQKSQLLFIYFFTSSEFPSTIFFVNLAMADIMFPTFIAPQYILSQTFTHPGGVTGKVLCTLLTGGNCAWIGAVSSVFTSVNISIERYYTVMYPLSNKGNLSERKLVVSDVLRKNAFKLFTVVNQLS